MAFPTSPIKGQTHTEYGESYFFNGVAWSKGFVKTMDFGDCVFDSTAPSSPEEGLYFFDYTTNQLKRYTSGVWSIVTGV